MNITKKEFESYEKVRASGVTNMWDVKKVRKLSGLAEEKILKIIKHYSVFAKKYKTKKGGKK